MLSPPVPKSIVRFRLCLDSQEYYNHHVLNFLQEENLRAHTSLVTVLKNGKRKVYKKDLKEKFPFKKEWLADFTKENPQVLDSYKTLLKQLPGAAGVINHRDLDEEFDETSFANSLMNTLSSIPTGNSDASKYHSFIVGLLEFVLWPNLVYPKKETEIHEGRKRIDITYTNAAKDGFFDRMHRAHHVASNIIMVECKNYTKDIANPELDQLSGRFSVNRGKFGLLLYRATEDYKLLLKRCKDTANDGRGYILPLGDEQLCTMLKLISDRKRRQIDQYLDDLFRKVIS